MYKIAIIDDVTDSCDLLSYLLSPDYDVACYESGAAALLHFEENSPDLIIMDIWLQGMSGVEVLQQLRQNTRLRKVPVIALTADAMMGDRERYLADGFDEYVSKPIINLQEFLVLVRRFLP